MARPRRVGVPGLPARVLAEAARARPTGRGRADDRPHHEPARAFRGTHTAGRSPEELRELVSHVGAELELAPPEDIIEWAVATFGDRFCITSSMADAVLADIASRVAPGIDVVFLDTGYHFAETMGTADAVGATMDVTLIPITPVQSVAEQDAAYGPELFQARPRPVLRAPQGAAAATRRSRSTTPGRPACAAPRPTTGSSRRWSAGTPKKSKVKVSPLARWTDDDVERYVAEHGVLVNPLVYDGYPSIGCAPARAASLPARTRAAGAGPAPPRPSAGSTHDPHPDPDRQRRRSRHTGDENNERRPR